VSAHILVLVEQDETSRQVVESLKRSGHNVTAAKCFSEAIRIIPTNRIDMIVSEVHLENGGNVFDFMRWVKRNPATHAIGFVMFSSQPTVTAKYLEDGLRTTARILGASKYMSMDHFDSDEFSRQIDALLPEGD
jgi:CheY-like chemotaxis protein